MKNMNMFVEARAVDGEQMIVEGYISSEAIDTYNTIFTAGSIRAALERNVPSIRAMHNGQMLPVGTIVKWWQEGDKTAIRVQLLDTQLGVDTWKAVKGGAIKGFSIGFSPNQTSQREDGVTVFEDIDLVEISLVDAPSNPDATITGYRDDERGMLRRIYEWITGRTREGGDNVDKDKEREYETRIAEEKGKREAAEKERDEKEAARKKTAEELDKYHDEEFRASLVEAGYQPADVEQLTKFRAVFEANPELLELYRGKPEPKKVPKTRMISAESNDDPVGVYLDRHKK